MMESKYSCNSGWAPLLSYHLSSVTNLQVISLYLEPLVSDHISQVTATTFRD